jgi:hypothetical protein
MAILLIGSLCFVPLALMMWDLVTHTSQQEQSRSTVTHAPVTR